MVYTAYYVGTGYFYVSSISSTHRVQEIVAKTQVSIPDIGEKINSFERVLFNKTPL